LIQNRLAETLERADTTFVAIRPSILVAICIGATVKTPDGVRNADHICAGVAFIALYLAVDDLQEMVYDRTVDPAAKGTVAAGRVCYDSSIVRAPTE